MFPFEPVMTWPVDARLVELLDGYVVTAGDQVRVWQADGTAVATLDAYAIGLAVATIQGERRLLVCTADGLLASSFSLPSPTVLDPDPCVAVRETTDGFVTLGETGLHWTSDLASEPLPLAGTLLAVRDDGTILAASPGDAVVQLDDGTSLEAGGAIGGLSSAGWTLPADNRLVPWGAEPVDVAATPKGIAALPGGRIVLQHPAALGVWDGAETLTDAVVTALSTSTEACAILATSDGVQVTLWREPGCVDADGDGSAADEDCDDADPSVHPGAPDVCDGVDNDCDGTVDGPVTLEVRTTPLSDDPAADEEGGAMGFRVEGEVCGAPIWSLGGERAGDCRDTGDGGLRCDWTDNGTLEVRVEAAGGSGALDLDVANVEPWTIAGGVCGCSCDACLVDTVLGEPGEHLVTVLATDMPGDNLLCSLSAPVPGLRLDGCVATWDVPDEGTWDVDLEAWDKDGARVGGTVYFWSDTEQRGALCAPVGARSLLGIAAGIALLRRRGKSGKTYQNAVEPP